MSAVAANTMHALRGEYRQQEPLARHTSWAVGGVADAFYRPADAADLADFLSSLPADEPLTWLGLGSNVLVRDGGIRGTVISLRSTLNDLQQLNDTTFRAGAGLNCSKFARKTAAAGLAGGAFFAGIPGTIGGALAMNAGAHGGETWQRVIAVETIDRRGQIHRRSPNEFEIAYRSVTGVADEWFIAAEFAFVADEDGQALAEIRHLLDQRSATQPIEQRSCGSVFRNPAGDYSARLIEACGLKGYAIGGAQVSPKHANFIVNNGTATAAEIEQLIAHVQATVAQQQGVNLVHEVRILGEAA